MSVNRVEDIDDLKLLRDPGICQLPRPDRAAASAKKKLVIIKLVIVHPDEDAMAQTGCVEFARDFAANDKIFGFILTETALAREVFAVAEQELSAA